MAVTNGTVHSVETLRANHTDPFQVAHILFTMSGTYAQADNSLLAGVAALIQNSRRNGKTVTLIAGQLMGGQLSRKESNPALYMALKTLAVAGADITFEITEGATPGVPDFATELANGAIPVQSVPFGVLIGFTES